MQVVYLKLGKEAIYGAVQVDKILTRFATSLRHMYCLDCGPEAIADVRCATDRNCPHARSSPQVTSQPK